MERHVLVVLAHPDDESFGCGGQILLHSRAGTPVTYVCATRGEMGRRMGSPTFATRETLRDLRTRELRAACDVLGVKDLRHLDIWDKTVEFVDPELLARRVRAIIEEVNPSLIITFHPIHGGHPDHNAIGAATIEAVRSLPPERRLVVKCMLNWRIVEKLQMPVEIVDISATVEGKWAAIAAHTSQSQNMESMWPQDPALRERMQAERQRERYYTYPF